MWVSILSPGFINSVVEEILIGRLSVHMEELVVFIFPGVDD